MVVHLTAIFPNKLLLTSEYDVFATTQAIVQAALDHIISEKHLTTVTIAHRLSTVRDMDAIAVVDEVLQPDPCFPIAATRSD